MNNQLMNLRLKQLTFLISLSFFFLFLGQAKAHHPEQSYLYLRIYKDDIGGRFEMTAKDINKALNLNLVDDLTMEDLQKVLPQIQEYLLSRSNFKSVDGEYPIRFTEPTILDLEEMEDFVRFHFELENVEKVPDELDIYYNVLFDQDSRHNGIQIVEYNWKAGIIDNEALLSLVFDKGNTQQTLSLSDVSLWKGFVAMVKLGMWHIWIGIDHILFVLALILPSVVRRRKPDQVLPVSSDTWFPVDRFKPAFMYIVTIITFFTIAHSITLALAALDVVNLPSRMVESIIAFSIAIAAFHNIKPILLGKEWLIAFGFGLFHGFGFASVLGEKGLSGDYMVLSLLGFNVGVEIGQLLIVFAIFPVLFLIRKSKWYPPFIKYGSILLILVALHWTIERALGINLRLGDLILNLF